jgi:sulfite exporter TauE/SafE/copper chaperone CopZ
MTSRDDELRVERELARIPFVIGVAASGTAGTVLVEGARELPEWALERAIRIATTRQTGAPTPPAAARPTSTRREAARQQPVDLASTVRSDGTVTTTVPILGMTCRSCEVRIERSVSKVPHVEKVSASATRGRVVIESTRQLSARAVSRAIGAAGYEIGRSPWIERDHGVWGEIVASAVIIGAIAFLAQAIGVADLASGAGDLASGGLVVALVLGLVAGVSTCMALVGGLVMGLSASFQSSGTVRGLAAVRPTLVFLAGRVAGYGLLGAALGAIGGSVAMPPLLTAALMIVVALVMTLLGARLTGASPRIAGWTPTLPMGIARRLGVTDGPGSIYSDRRALAFGAATFFLPCGFTQAVQVFALSTGSPLFAGALLATFAIGTAPGLLAVGGLPALVPSGGRPTLLRFVGVAVLGFAVLNGTAGLRLAGIGIPSLGLGTVAAAALPGVGADGVQELNTYQEADGYGPRGAAIYANVPTRWTIDSRSSVSCAKFIVVPALNMSMSLEPGLNTYELPPLPAGRLDYSCSMGMYGGSIRIVDAPAPSPGAAASR